MTKIISWADKFGGVSMLANSRRFPSSVGDRTPPAPGIALDVTAAAIVNAGRWLAICPTDGCGGAEYVDLDNPLLFCCECRNAATNHQPIVVVIPAVGKRQQIEAYLVSRPAPATRNWFPDETVADLRDENRAHGIRLLKGDD